MAKDKLHDFVKNALIKDGWQITADPYIIETDDVDYEVDLGAEKIISAEKGGERIAVEVKSFIAPSFVYEFHLILGQFLNYSIGIEEFDPQRTLYLAVPVKVYNEYFHLSFVAKAIKRYKLKLLIYEPENEKIITWKKK
jgi:hypothetical protein